MLEILQAPNPVLLNPSTSVKNVDSSIKKLIRQMGEALEEAKDPIGVGLAAPQVGKALRIFVAKQTPKSKMRVFINPRIISKEPLEKAKNKKNLKKLEGCLSLKDIWGDVERSPKIVLEYLDENGLKHVATYQGFLATVIQHEIDHLEGILFTKRVLEQKGNLYESTKDEKGQDIFEELKI